MPPRSAERRVARLLRPKHLRHLPDDVLPRHRPPDSGVAGGRTVVTLDEVVAGRQVDRRVALGVATVGLDVGLVELLAANVVVAVSLRPGLTGQGDDPLDEDAAGAAAL